MGNLVDVERKVITCDWKTSSMTKYGFSPVLDENGSHVKERGQFQYNLPPNYKIQVESRDWYLILNEKDEFIFHYMAYMDYSTPNTRLEVIENPAEFTAKWHARKALEEEKRNKEKANGVSAFKEALDHYWGTVRASDGLSRAQGYVDKAHDDLMKSWENLSPSLQEQHKVPEKAVMTRNTFW